MLPANPTSEQIDESGIDKAQLLEFAEERVLDLTEENETLQEKVAEYSAELSLQLDQIDSDNQEIHALAKLTPIEYENLHHNRSIA